ncbi:MAG: proton-conducting transporter membrane subunit [Eubacterium coprostanoligenes]|uniref:NADH-quinone oxidoreductase subunit 5 family protein n=1 Tax=Eubacterium coprostanoligenes TaxID=290054 RepID=UPI002409DEF6|nr:proton-conducting transporter membrane subunit [Eubacterium coprostanoligenes]MDD6665699.1 proton-conducting transporter membrane subunit [Eubacterium coprostanoligenes]
MEIMIAFLVGFPFVSALLHGIVKDNKTRKVITYTSAGLIIFAALMFTVTYHIKGGGYITFNEEFLIGGLPFVEIVDYLMVAGEVFLVVLITVLSIKYKKYYAAVLSIAQTALEFWYEFSGIKPKNQISNFYCDQLTIIMILIIAIVGTFITIYACGYMDDYHHHHGNEVKDRRGFFFAIMYVFIGAMFGLVLSNNLIWLYFFWEVTSVCSFLLIGYTRSAEAITNCFKALWMNLLGGLGMAIGIVMLGVNHSVTSLQGILEQDKSLIVLPIICLSFGALTKSAQLPFSRWLLGAMVAPTPSSALLHSATMVKAGVYLLIRMAPAMSGEFSGYMVGLVGGLTFLAMSMLAITAYDGKKVLAYSTLSNLGLITACAGIGTEETVWAAIFLVIFHAVSKSLLFQTVGSIEHQTGSRDIETMHGLVRRYPYLTWTLVVGIAGMFLAPFGMLVSKWAALKAFVDTGLASGNTLEIIVSTLLVLCICFGSATTLFYWSKWLATVLSSNPSDKRHKNTISINQWASLFTHGGLMILIVFVFPLISKYVVKPYTAKVFRNEYAVISYENIILTILMVIFIFVIPIANYFLIAKNRPFPKADRYFNGVGTPDQIGFVDSFGKEKKEFLTNWYMEDIFGESHMYKPSVYTSIFLIVAFTIAAIVTGGVC